MSDYEQIKVEESTDHSPIPSQGNEGFGGIDVGAGAQGVPLLGQASITKLSENITGAAEDRRNADGDSADMFKGVDTELQGE